jgi:ATP-dependent HslUV protease ATP-binding subunit HslU
VLEELSFTAPEKKGDAIEVDAKWVKDAVEPLCKKVDITKFLL